MGNRLSTLKRCNSQRGFSHESFDVSFQSVHSCNTSSQLSSSFCYAYDKSLLRDGTIDNSKHQPMGLPDSTSPSEEPTSESTFALETTQSSKETTPKETITPGLAPGMHYLQQPVIFDVTSEGGVFPDPAKKDQQQCMGVSIEVPQGAIPDDKTASIEVAVCLGIGPVKYPEGTTPISLVLKLHPKESFTLLKPIKVTVPHILSDNARAEDIGVMKSVSGENQFEIVTEDVTLETVDGQKVATFYLDHFCYVELYGKVTSDSVSGIEYCICPVLPKEVPSNSKSFKLYYCITYWMKACRDVIEKQCGEVKRLENYQLDYDEIRTFTFPSGSNQISATCNKPEEGSGWRWSLHSRERGGISESSVRPWEIDEIELEDQTSKFLFPPHFTLTISGPGTAADVIVDFTTSSGEEGKDTQPIATMYYHLADCVGEANSTIPVEHSLTSNSLETGVSSVMYQVIRRNTSFVANAISTNLLVITSELFSKEVITQDLANRVWDSNSTLSESDKAIKIVDHVCKVVRTESPLTRAIYRKFVDVVACKATVGDDVRSRLVIIEEAEPESLDQREIPQTDSGLVDTEEPVLENPSSGPQIPEAEGMDGQVTEDAGLTLATEDQWEDVSEKELTDDSRRSKGELHSKHRSCCIQ